MKLTAAIAASYFGAEVRCAPYGGSPDRKLIGTMIGLNNDGIQVKFLAWQSHQHQVEIGVCQLILTPLDKISEADCVEVVNSVGLDTEGVGKIISTFIDFEKRLVLDFEYQVFRVRLSVEVIDYLRSKGYDCGHGSIPNLIAAGVAVEKEIV